MKSWLSPSLLSTLRSREMSEEALFLRINPMGTRANFKSHLSCCAGFGETDERDTGLVFKGGRQCNDTRVAMTQV